MNKQRFFIAPMGIIALVATMACTPFTAARVASGSSTPVATPATPTDSGANAVVNIKVTGCGSKAEATSGTNNWFYPNARAVAVAENAPCPEKKDRHKKKDDPATKPTPPAPIKPAAPKPQAKATPKPPVHLTFDGTVEEAGQFIDSLRGNKEDPVFSLGNVAPPKTPTPSAGTPIIPPVNFLPVPKIPVPTGPRPRTEATPQPPRRPMTPDEVKGWAADIREKEEQAAYARLAYIGLHPPNQ